MPQRVRLIRLPPPPSSCPVKRSPRPKYAAGDDNRDAFRSSLNEAFKSIFLLFSLHFFPFRFFICGTNTENIYRDVNFTEGYLYE